MHVLATSFLGLYLAHMVTDFVLKSDRVSAGKRRGAVLAYLEHGGIHFLAAAFLLGFAIPGLWRKFGFYGVLVALTLVHLGIDWCKVGLVRSKKIAGGAVAFFGDQAVHFVIVGIAAWLIARPSAASLLAKIHWFQSEVEKPLLLLVVYVGVIFGGGYVVRFLTKPLVKRNVEVVGETMNELENAGMYIGWLERFVVLTALMLQSPATVGLILTAKSIARYPELKSVRFAEYFLIGTLLSLTLGIFGGLILLKAFYGTVTLGK
jgi:Protein of unknown function (DUF3307)